MNHAYRGISSSADHDPIPEPPSFADLDPRLKADLSELADLVSALWAWNAMDSSNPIDRGEATDRQERADAIARRLS